MEAPGEAWWEERASKRLRGRVSATGSQLRVPDGHVSRIGWPLPLGLSDFPFS